MRHLFLIVGILILGQMALGQGLKDTLIHIPGVQISAHSLFNKQQAGTRETKIDSVLLTRQVGKSLSELLSQNSNIYIRNYGRGALATASFRGTAVSHTQVSWNGLALNSPMSGIVDFSLIPLFIADEINLQHGASSIAYRSGGLGGHVDIRNQTAWKEGIHGGYYQGAGSYRTFDEYARINAGNRHFQSSTRLYHSASENNYPYINTSLIDRPKLYMEGADYRKAGIMQAFYYRLSEKSSFSARSWYQDAKRGIPLVMSYEGADTSLHRENRQSDRTLKAVLEGKRYGEKLRMVFSSGLDYQQLDYSLKIRVSDLQESKPVNSASLMLGFYNQLKLDYDWSDDLSSTLRTSYNYYHINSLDSANQEGYSAFRHEFSSYVAVFATFLDRVNLSLGFRKDYITDLRTPLIYNLGISYKPTDLYELVIKADFARNYHNPSLNQLYWQPGGNPDLQPEEGHTFETGIQQIIQRKHLRLEYELSVYYSDIRNWIIWLPGFKGYWEASNIREVRAWGIDFQTKAEWNFGKNSLKAIGNYLFSRSLNYGEPLVAGDESEGMQLPFIPVHSGNLLIRLSRQGWYLDYQYEYCGIRHLLSSNRIGILDDSWFFNTENAENPFYRLYAQHLNHLSVGKELEWKKIQLGIELHINNLFNEVYRNILNRYMPGRHYLVTLKIDF